MTDSSGAAKPRARRTSSGSARSTAGSTSGSQKRVARKSAAGSRRGAATTRKGSAAKAPPAGATAARGARSRDRRQTGAQALVAQLEALGVEIVFGIPGVHNLSIFDALRRSSIRTVVVRHEQTCVYAADGYARATGRLGVAITTTGPGAANAAAAMGEARASRSPVLHLSTQIESRLLEGRGGRWSLHESPNQKDLMSAVSVWAGTVARAEAIPSMIQRAAKAAFENRRGPTFVDIPHDFLDAPVEWRAQPPLRSLPLSPEPGTVARAASVLDAASRPAIWAGGGAIASGAGEVLSKVAEALDAPVVTTFAAKGILAPDHPLLVGFPPHQPEVTALLGSSDALLVVGSDLDGMSTQGWRLPLPRPRVSLNSVADDMRRNYAADVAVEADAALALQELLSLLGSARKANGAKRVESVRRAARRALDRGEYRDPMLFVDAVEAALPADAFVCGDMAIPGYWLAGYHRARAQRSFAFPLGWGTLGFALPAGIGVASTGRRTLVVCGDGGLAFAPGEIATAVQEQLPLTVLVVNDGGYGMLRFDERERFGDTFATDLHTGDLVGIAKAYGTKARRCDQPGLARALAWAFKQQGPSLVELTASFAPPPTTSPRWPLKGKAEARP